MLIKQKSLLLLRNWAHVASGELLTVFILSLRIKLNGANSYSAMIILNNIVNTGQRLEQKKKHPCTDER